MDLLALATVLGFLAFVGMFHALGDVILEGVLSLRGRGLGGSGGLTRELPRVLRSGAGGRALKAIIALVGGLVGLSIGGGAAGFAAGVGLGWLMPAMIQGRRNRKREEHLAEQLVPMLNLVANAMRAGKTLPQAIEEVPLSIDRPMSDEVAITARQMRVGVDPEVALRDLADRLALSDAKLAARAMIVSIRTGANLPEALRGIIDTVQSRMRVESKIRVLTTQGNLQAVIVGAAPFVLLILFYVMSPQYVSPMFDTELGNVLLGGMFALQVAAVFTIRRIVSVDV